MRRVIVGKKIIERARKMSTLFADAHQASNYALYRPDYPNELFDKVNSYSSIQNTGVVTPLIISRKIDFY